MSDIFRRYCFDLFWTKAMPISGLHFLFLHVKSFLLRYFNVFLPASTLLLRIQIFSSSCYLPLLHFLRIDDRVKAYLYVVLPTDFLLLMLLSYLIRHFPKILTLIYFGQRRCWSQDCIFFLLCQNPFGRDILLFFYLQALYCLGSRFSPLVAPQDSLFIEEKISWKTEHRKLSH